MHASLSSGISCIIVTSARNHLQTSIPSCRCFASKAAARLQDRDIEMWHGRAMRVWFAIDVNLQRYLGCCTEKCRCGPNWL